MDYTPISEISKIHEDLRKTFRTGLTKSIEWRRNQLYQLARFAKENSDALVECLRLDLGRPKQETILAEIGPIVSRSLSSAEKLDEWMKSEPISLSAPWHQSFKMTLEKPSKGVVLIISPWNYPIVLALQPLYGAIAAGCCAALKLSEFTPHCSTFMAQNLLKYLDNSAYRVILGAVPEITKTLELKWDHIFYTGNGRVARIISAAAAKHLTPLTLELGGKSPVIVDRTADISISAKRILWGKINNAGQICVSPDYIIAEKSIVPELLEFLKEHYKTFYPEGALASDSYSRIVSDSHFERLKGLIAKTKGEVVMGGTWEEGEGKYGFEPTVVIVEKGDILLEDELFGPILPILAVDSVDDAIDYLNDRDHPLVLYVFSRDEDAKKNIIANTTSGSVAIGDTFQQVGIDEFPFGGVGESGYGRQIMKYSFENFVYQRPVVDVPYEDEPSYGFRYPPYTLGSLAIFSEALTQPIPDPIPNGHKV